MIDNDNRRWEIYGSFLSDGVEFAIDAHELQEVVHYDKTMANVPLSPAYFLGIFSLRESIIPVVNLRALLGQEPHQSCEDNCIAIVHVEGVRIGLLFDSTSEVLRIDKSQLKPFEYSGESCKTPVCGTITMKGGERLVQVLDAKKFTQLEQIPINKNTPTDGTFSYRNRAKSKCITFLSSGILYGFRIDSVREIISKPEIVVSGIKSKTCLGQAELRGTTFPVLDFAKLCNGDRAATGEGIDKRVIIANVEDQPVGFLVDGVDSIVEYYLDSLQRLPTFSGDSSTFCLGCISLENQSDISMVDHELLYSVPEVTAPVAAIAEGNAYKKKENAAEQVAHVAQTYLVVEMGFSFALPVDSITEIIEVPDDIIPITRGPAFVLGMFNLRKILVTVIDLRALYDLKPAKITERHKLIVVKYQGSFIALKVDAVEDIFSSKPGSVHETPHSLVRGASQAFVDDAGHAILHKGKVVLAFDFNSMMARLVKALPAEQLQSHAA